MIHHQLFFILSSIILASGQPNGLFGRDNFECPDGFHISQFSSQYTQLQRSYAFSCQPVAPMRVSDEECIISEVADTAGGDIYLTCPDTHYTAGLSRFYDNTRQLWTLLCCKASNVQVRDEACISTSFLNNYHSTFEFKSGQQIIRKWQAIYDEKLKLVTYDTNYDTVHPMRKNVLEQYIHVHTDRRWWLQICPVDHDASNDGTHPLDHTRFTRAADPFGRSRLPSGDVKFNVMPFSFTPPPPIQPITRQSVTSRADRAFIQATDPPSTTRRSPPMKKPEANNVDVDYYDYYYEATEKPSLIQLLPTQGGLDGVHEFMQNVQDGLTLAQMVVPASDDLNKSPPSRDGGGVAFSVDQSAQVVRTIPTNQQQPPGALQNMLQFLGLCQGHI